MTTKSSQFGGYASVNHLIINLTKYINVIYQATNEFNLFCKVIGMLAKQLLLNT